MPHLEPAVIFHYNVCKVDSLSAAHKLPYLRVVVSANVISHKVAVDAVSPPLLLVQEKV